MSELASGFLTQRPAAEHRGTAAGRAGGLGMHSGAVR